MRHKHFGPSSSYFRDLAAVSTEEVLRISIELCSLHAKYTSRWKDGELCWECGRMHHRVRLPRIKPTGGSSRLVRWNDE